MPSADSADAGFAPAELASDRASLLRDAILDSLVPPKSTDDRETQIPASYAQTFSWIFDHDFGRWLGAPEPELRRLTSGSQPAHDHARRTRSSVSVSLSVSAPSPHPPRLFWINGLPGSGKSTLLRYIHQSRRLHASLSTWTDDARPEVASFFFWESGTILQRSQEGFLRSLLAQLLGRRPSLVHLVFRALWSQIWSCDTAERVRTLGEWPLERLLQGLLAYFELGSNRPPTLLLVDGLDELEGDPQVVLDLFAHISTCERVKLCISSRPYSVFDAWFSGVDAIRLQDLTGDDIEGFVRGRLAEHPASGKMSDKHRAELVRRIQGKAEGVFLWATVALDVLAETDAFDDQLALLPSSLDGLYRYRLIETTPDPVLLSQLFQLMRARQAVAAFTRMNDTSVMTVREGAAAVDDVTAEQVVAMSIAKADRARVAETCKVFCKALHRASQGLLQVQQGDMELMERLINYKHRTVKDWLVNPDVWSDILRMGPSLDAHVAHLRANLVLFKSPPDKPRKARNINGWWSQLVLCFTHARMAQPDSTDTYTFLLELNNTMRWYWPAQSPDPRIDSWARSCFGTLESRGKNVFEDPFFALAIRFGLVDFVRLYLKAGEYRAGDGVSVLEQATAFLVHRQSTIYPLASPELVRLLLDFGLDVDHQAVQPEQHSFLNAKPKPNKTPWETVVGAVQQADRRGWIEVETQEGRANVDRWTAIVRMYKDNGARMDVRIAYSYKDKKESATDLLRRLADKYPYEPIARFA